MIFIKNKKNNFLMIYPLKNPKLDLKSKNDLYRNIFYEKKNIFSWYSHIKYLNKTYKLRMNDLCRNYLCKKIKR